MPSTVISKMIYNIDKKILRIIFLSGAIYDYLNVPENIYKEMQSAFSKGEFLNKFIKNNFPFKKIQ
ncbi:MAG: KTSC domain-containing protein [Bacteroidota bacterium]